MDSKYNDDKSDWTPSYSSEDQQDWSAEEQGQQRYMSSAPGEVQEWVGDDAQSESE